MRARARTQDLTEQNARFGQYLRQVRLNRGLSVTECAQHIKTSRQRYTQMESGTAMITVAEAFSLLTLLGVVSPNENETGVLAALSAGIREQATGSVTGQATAARIKRELSLPKPVSVPIEDGKVVTFEMDQTRGAVIATVHRGREEAVAHLQAASL